MRTDRILALVALLALAAGPLVAQKAGDDAEVLLQAAMHKEQVEGRLPEAITAYKQVIANAGSNKNVAATAALQLARIYEKLGQPEARQTYQAIVRDYPNQPAVVAAARAKLGTVANRRLSQTEPQTRLLWDKATDLWGTVSSDGRWFSFPDWDTGDLGLRDLVGGVSRRVTNKGGYAVAKGEVEASAVSPDGNLIAFAWDRWDAASKTEGPFQMRVIRSDGTGEQVVLSGSDISYIEPQSWSADAKWIATRVETKGKPGGGIVLVAADGSHTRTVVTLSDRRVLKTVFSPDGAWLAFHTGTPTAGSLASGPDVPDLFIIAANSSSNAPAKIASNAMLLGWTPDGGILYGRDRNGSLDVYLQPMLNGSVHGDAVNINSISDVGAAVGVTSQGALIYGKTRRITDAAVAPIDVLSGAVGPFQNVMPIAAIGLGGRSGGIRFSPDGKQALYTVTSATLLIRNLTDGTEHRVMPQMARIGAVAWGSDSASLLISGSTAAGTEGVYRVDTSTGAATLLFAQPSVYVLAPSPDGRTLYYRKPAQGPVVARDLTSGTERTLLPGGGGVFDLKLSRDGTKLAVEAGKQLRIVDVATGAATVRFEGDDDSMDRFWGVAWSPDGQDLLALVSIGPTHARMELWRLAVSGGAPVRQAISGTYRGIWLNADGSQLGTIRWEQLLQIWIAENFLPSASTRSPTAR